MMIKTRKRFIAPPPNFFILFFLTNTEKKIGRINTKKKKKKRLNLLEPNHLFLGGKENKSSTAHVAGEEGEKKKFHTARYLFF